MSRLSEDLAKDLTCVGDNFRVSIIQKEDCHSFFDSGTLFSSSLGFEILLDALLRLRRREINHEVSARFAVVVYPSK